MSQMSSSLCSAKSDRDSVSMSSEDAIILEFDPQASPTKHTKFNYNSSMLQNTMDDSGSSSVNSESRLNTTDRERHSNDYLEQHNYEPIDDQPVLHHNEPMSTHTSGWRPPVKVKANMGKEQVTKLPTSDTNTEQPTYTTPQQHTLLNMAAPARHDYKNHTLSFQQKDGQLLSHQDLLLRCMHMDNRCLPHLVLHPDRSFSNGRTLNDLTLQGLC